MSRGLPLVILSFLGCLQWLCAGSPLIRFPEGDARWTIDISYSSTAGGGKIQLPENRMTRAVVTRRGDVRRDQIWWSRSQASEVWVSVAARLRVYENPDNGSVYVIPFNDSIMTLFVPREFDDDLFDWVAPGLFTGVENYEGKPCKVYAGDISRVFRFPGTQEKVITLPPLPHKAWIDAETDRPVALDTGIAFHRFAFDAGEGGPLVMPDRLRLELERYLNDLAPSKRIERLRARNAQAPR